MKEIPIERMPGYYTPAQVRTAARRLIQAVERGECQLRTGTLCNLLRDLLKATADGRLQPGRPHITQVDEDTYVLPPGCIGKYDCQCPACLEAEEEDRRFREDYARELENRGL